MIPNPHNYAYFDIVTARPCATLNGVAAKYVWVKFAPNGRPKTRNSNQIITLAVHEQELAKQAQEKKEATKRAQAAFGKIVDADTDLRRLQHVCEVQQATLKWLYDEVLDFKYDYSRGRVGQFRAAADIINSDGDRAGAPKWVLDCLATVYE